MCLHRLHRGQFGWPQEEEACLQMSAEQWQWLAPKPVIAVYFSPNSDKEFLDAITTAIHDNINKPSVISISWGAAEKNWTPQAMASFDQAFQAAATLGVTICCASGDAGSGDENPDVSQPAGLAHVDFPGSSPSVLCCGGTRLARAATQSHLKPSGMTIRCAAQAAEASAISLPCPHTKKLLAFLHLPTRTDASAAVYPTSQEMQTRKLGIRCVSTD